MQSQNEIRQSITDRIVAALKQGKIPWRRPWTEVPNPAKLPTNYVSKRAYSGINVPLLWLTEHEKGYPVSYWASFQQWRSMGASVKKGEKATGIVFYRQVKKTVEQENGETKVESFPLMRTWSVFNVSQVEGEVTEQFKAKPNEGIETFPAVDRTEFDRLIAAIGADIRYGYDRAAYVRPPADQIVMPDENQFVSFPAFAETLLHELAHYSEGSEADKRTGWTGTYAEGELRAEMASCFLMAALGIPGGDLTNHAAYVQSWLQALENDPKHIFKASAAASKAADYLLGFVRPKEGATEAEEEAAVSA
jgi:antirestriction protein ArdC